MATDATLNVKANTSQAEKALSKLQKQLIALGTVRELVRLADATTNITNKLRSVSRSA